MPVWVGEEIQEMLSASVKAAEKGHQQMTQIGADVEWSGLGADVKTSKRQHIKTAVISSVRLECYECGGRDS